MLTAWKANLQMHLVLRSASQTPAKYIYSESRAIVAHKKHVSEIIELTAEERSAFMEDIAKVAQAMHDLFHPDKVNYGAYGDTGHHLHFHLVPKYRDQYEWGGVFAMNPGEKKLTDAEYEEMVKRYQEKLEIK